MLNKLNSLLVFIVQFFERAFENRVLRRIFVSKRDEILGRWRILKNEDLSNFYSSPNIIRMIKSRRMGRVGNVVCMGEERNAYKVLVENQK
jgi:hypothetical protein